jgi:hypothetical protein
MPFLHCALLFCFLCLVSSGCGTTLTPRERGGLIGYTVGSGIGAGVGVAAGNPAVGALAGGPIGAASGALIADRTSRDRELQALREQLARQEDELQSLRDELRTLSRKFLLEP